MEDNNNDANAATSTGDAAETNVADTSTSNSTTGDAPSNTRNRSRTTNPPFLAEAFNQEEQTLEDFNNKDVLDYYRDMPVERHSHEDFEYLVDLTRMLWHNKMYLEQEVRLRDKRIQELHDLNDGLNTLSARLGQRIADENQAREALLRVTASYRSEYTDRISSITLDNRTYRVTASQIRQLFQWYCPHESIYFRAGDTYAGEGEGGPGIHSYTLFEIVQRRFLKKNGTTSCDEVLLMYERCHICDVVTMREFRRAGCMDKHMKPKFVWFCDIQPLNPRRYFMSQETIVSTVNELFGR